MKIAAVTRIKNGYLYAAAEKVGGQSALARLLKQSTTQVCAWCNMRGAPPKEPNRLWSPERLWQLEKVLYDLTGKTLDEIFPDELRDKGFQKQDRRKVQYADIEIQQLEGSNAERIAIEDNRFEDIEMFELRESMEKALHSLKPREAFVIRSRFGFNGERKTLQEIANLLYISRGRVADIERQAIRKLQAPSLCQQLVGFVD